MSIFNRKVKIKDPIRSNFDLSHSNLYTSKFSRLELVDCLEVMPGDRWRLSVQALTRLMPLYAPAMVRLDQKFAFFFVPYRILSDNWEKFIVSAGSLSVGNKIDPLPPSLLTCTSHELAQICGTNVSYARSYFNRLRYSNVDSNYPAIRYNLFAPIAYNYIWSEYFRNENLQDPLDIEAIRKMSGYRVDLTSSDKDLLDTFLNHGEHRLVNWRKDYLTASQPWTQKGNQVIVPIRGELPEFILRTQVSHQYFLGVDSSLDTVLTGSNLNGSFAPNVSTLTFKAEDSNGNPISIQTSLTINDLRESNALQRFLEKRAIGGTRLVEYLLIQHGTKMSDKTARRPEWISGSSIPIQIGELLQTSQSDPVADSPLGRFAGTGYGRGAAAGGEYYCEEHGLILLVSWIQPPTAYTNGCKRMHTRIDPLDFPLPAFAHLGQQEVYNFEAMGNSNQPTAAFGYLGRYDEMRTELDIINGDFKDTLDDWHMGRLNVGPDIALNETFIRSDATTRIFNVQDSVEDYVLTQSYIHAIVKRNLPTYANPML